MPIFEQAANDYLCPVELLLVLGQMGSAFENRGGVATIEQGYGLMALRQNRWGAHSLELASSLTGVKISQLKIDPVANIRGAAAVLDEYARQAGINRTEGLESWVPVVVRYAGLDDENSQLFAMQLFQKLQRGFTVTNSRGETFSVAPVQLAIVPERLVPEGILVLEVDYWSAVPDPAATCNYSTISTDKNMVVIHMAEGSAAGIRAWYKNCEAAESMHYVVSEVGTVWQMVREHYIAEQRTCYNNWAVGITHEGFSASPSHPTALYVGSALLCRDICNRWSIPKRHATNGGTGITGHEDLNVCCCSGDDVDPGDGWDWDYYLSEVFETSPPAIVSAVSRKQHGTAGVFDLDVLDPSAVEPRQNGLRTLVVTFDKEIECVGVPDASDVILSNGLVYGLSIDSCELMVEIDYTPEMEELLDGSVLTVEFPGIVSTDYHVGVLDTLCFAILEGDMNGDRKCNLFDMADVRDAMVTGLDGGNFVCDVNLDGQIDLLDVGRVRGNMDQAILGL